MKYTAYNTERTIRQEFSSGTHNLGDGSVSSSVPFSMVVTERWVKPNSYYDYPRWVRVTYDPDSMQALPTPKPTPSWWRRLFSRSTLPKAKVIQR